MDAARCQLRNLSTCPLLRKWTMSLLIRYLPTGQMSALLMAFLSSSLPRLLTALQHSCPITSLALPAQHHLPSNPHPRLAASPSLPAGFARIFS